MVRGEKPPSFWIYPGIKGKGMKSDQIVQEYKEIKEGEMAADSLKEGLLNPPDQEYQGLDNYPYSGSFAGIENEWKLHQEGENFKLIHVENDPQEEHNLDKKIRIG